jgi:hypothetical protein
MSFLVTLSKTRFGLSVVFSLYPTLFFSQIILIGFGLPSGSHFIVTDFPSSAVFVPESKLPVG